MKRLRNILLFVAMSVWGMYRLRRRIFARLLKLSPPRYQVQVDKGLRLLMRDGITLVTDHYYPVSEQAFPTILIRSPYGRGAGYGIFGSILTFFAYRFAERGYHVVIQDTRGRFDSSGVFDPYLYERDDGLATLDWLAGQTWFDGKVGMWGPSYLGLVQWAVAADSPSIKALVPSVTGSQLFSIVYPDGALDLGLAMRWPAIFQFMDDNPHPSLLASSRLLRQVETATATAFTTLPLAGVDELATGKPVAYYRTWLDNAHADAELWAKARQAADLAKVTAPAHLIGGWYDFFLRTLLADYATLVSAGRQPYLTIGPWFHFSPDVMTEGLHEGLIWFDAQLKGDRSKLRELPVRVYVMGANQWRELPCWPSPARKAAYYLHADHRLGQNPPPDAATPPDRYRYDPAHPTPAVGGTQFGLGGGRRDNRTLEARADVLTYTTPPLATGLDVIGPVSFMLYAKSSLAHTDFFGRLCDVEPNGRSLNVCDGLFRIEPGKGQPQPDGSLCIEIDMWATAYHFRPGHRLRVQVSSGAHPRWIRNLGTGEPIGSAQEMRVAEQTIYHDADHPSALILPTIGGLPVVAAPHG